jgi:hypothetical protein
MHMVIHGSLNVVKTLVTLWGTSAEVCIGMFRKTLKRLDHVEGYM